MPLEGVEVIVDWPTDDVSVRIPHDPARYVPECKSAYLGITWREALELAKRLIDAAQAAASQDYQYLSEMSKGQAEAQGE